jgi:hypothetical protein
VAVKMPELDDVTLDKLAAICATSKSSEFFTAVRLAVDLAHFRERLKRHARTFEKIAIVAATLLQHIDALSADARAMFEEVLGEKNDIARDLGDFVQSEIAEYAENRTYEQMPLLFAFLTSLYKFEGLAHWIGGLPMPYTLAPRGPGPLYIQVGIDGRPISSRGRRGRPRGSKGLSSGYANFEVFVDHLTSIVVGSGGRLTFNDQHNSGTLVEALKILRSHLPRDCRAIPSRATMRRIKERSAAHLNRLTPEKLYDGAILAGPEHHEAIAAALRATGVDPATVDPLDIACAAEIHVREGAPPDEAFPIAVAHSLIESGYIDREVAKEALGDTVREKPRKSRQRRRRKRSFKK